MTIPSVLANQRLVVVDVEGNGQNPPEIIELAALSVDGDTTVADMRSWLVRPQKPITPIVTKKVHGIRNVDVADCPSWAVVAPEVGQLLADRVLVAHNASVEYRVLGAHLSDWTPPMVLDTLRLARYVWPELPSYSLDKLATHADLDLGAVAEQRYHRAAYDTWCAWKLLCALIDDGDLEWAGLVRAATVPGSAAPASTDQGGLW